MHNSKSKKTILKLNTVKTLTYRLFLATKTAETKEFQTFLPEKYSH